MFRLQRSFGFTLIELIVTIALIAVIAGFAVPSFSTMVANSRLASTSNDLVGLFNYARSEAVKTGRRVNITPTSGSDWSNGISVWIDQNADGSMQNTEELRRNSAAPGAVSITVSESFFFTGGGLIRNASGSAVTVRVCDDRSGEQGRSINISLGGRIRSEEWTCG